MTRTLIVLTGYLVLATAYWFAAPIPEPIKTVPVTEAQIKKEVKNEQREKQIKRSVAAARKVYHQNGCRDTYSDLTGRTAYEFGLSARMLAAVVVVESRCRASAVSGRNSVGLMQVNPRVWGHAKELKDPARNLQIGAAILSTYIRQFGIIEGLHHYNGYSEVHGHEYVNRVLSTAQMVVM